LVRGGNALGKKRGAVNGIFRQENVGKHFGGVARTCYGKVIIF